MICIVMGVYNGEKYLEEQVDSILNNTYKEWRLYIFDDGSNDKTLKIAKRYVKEYPQKIFFIRNEENKGAALNFLSGMQKCDGNYIMFCDQDDVWKPDKMEHTLARMKRMEKKYGENLPILIYTDAEVTDHLLQPIAASFHKASRLDPKKTDLSHLMMENKIIGCTMMINRALKVKVSVLPKHARMHDWWLGLIAAAFGKISYLSEQTMFYRQHENNVIGNQSFFLYVKKRMSSLAEQKQALKAAQYQAAEFYTIYEQELSPLYKEKIKDFASLSTQTYVNRRVIVIRNHFWKSGILRNIGILLLI